MGEGLLVTIFIDTFSSQAGCLPIFCCIANVTIRPLLKKKMESGDRRSSNPCGYKSSCKLSASHFPASAGVTAGDEDPC